MPGERLSTFRDSAINFFENYSSNYFCLHILEVKILSYIILGQYSPYILRIKLLLMCVGVIEIKYKPIQYTKDTKDVPSGKRGWHRPVAPEYAWRHFMQQPAAIRERHMYVAPLYAVPLL